MDLKQILARLAVLKAENENTATTAVRLLEIGAEVKSLEMQMKAIEDAPLPKDDTAQKKAVIMAERARVTDISALCREFEVEPDTFIKEGNSIDDVRIAILDGLKSKNPATKAAVNVTVVKDEMDKFKSAASDALLLKGGIKVDKPADGANQLRTASIIDLARECLNLEGRGNETRTLDKETLLRAALTAEGQFSGILDNTVNKSMQTAYTEAQTTYQLWTSRGSNPDFKATNRYQISEGGELKKINENGEFVDDKMTDSGVASKIVTYGRKFSLTRQAIINDDLSYLTKMPQAYARAARRGINKAIYAILNTNPAIYDGDTLFHVANHANWKDSAGAAPSIAQLDIMQQFMMKQTNLRGEEMLNIRPRFVIVPVELDVTTRQLLSSVNDPSVSVNPNTANPFNGRLDVISDAELTGAKAWFTAADPSNIDTIEVTYLNGQDMPTLESRIAWDVLGMEFRIFIDYGVTVIDYRGLAKNKGEN